MRNVFIQIGITVTSEELTNMMKAIDTDNSGSIEFDGKIEFSACSQKCIFAHHK